MNVHELHAKPFSWCLEHSEQATKASPCRLSVVIIAIVIIFTISVCVASSQLIQNQHINMKKNTPQMLTTPDECAERPTCINPETTTELLLITPKKRARH